MIKGAVLSDCGKYRYQLWRIWDETKPKVLFIMHNPSKADADVDDPTIRRCISFAKSWGFGGFYVGNISPYRATDPDELRGLDVDTLVPGWNQKYINDMFLLTTMRVLAWGIPSSQILRKLHAPKVFENHPVKWHCIQKTKDGWPGHPLFLKGNLTPIPY